ncbi:hypothetical protein V3C99_014135 [Haemonchus contortus]
MPFMTSQIIISVLILTKVIVWGEEPCSPWIWNVETEKCYRKFCDNSTAENAEKICKKFGGHLATICSEEENTFATDLARLNAGKDEILRPTWIGLKRDSSRKKWLWMSGSKCNYRHWAPVEPNDKTGDEDYSHFWTDMSDYRNWNDNRNKRNFHYLCEAPYCPLDD